MALLKGTQATRLDPVPTVNRATDCVPIFGDYVVVGTEAQNDVIEIVPLPNGYVPVDGYVDAEDCGTTFTCDMGVLTGVYRAALDTDGSTARVCGAQFCDNKAFGTAGIYRFDAVGMSRVAPVSYDRGMGLKVDAAVSSLTAGAKIRMCVWCRPAFEGV